MKQIKHKYVDIRGLKLHVAEIGTGPVVVFLHEFPEIWYSWSLWKLEPEKTTFKDLVDDLLAILDSFNISKVFLVAKEFGVHPAYHFAILYPERAIGVLSLGLPFMRRAGSEIPTAREDQEIMDLLEPSTPLPHWFSEEDLASYISLYEKSGFRTPLQVPYRLFHEGYGVELKVKVPAFVIMGEKDYALKFPGFVHYLNEMVRDYVPDMETYLPKGSHLVQEQFPDKANQLIISFLSKHT
ncbi:hypothetical protein GIB67_004486 [Kingdonia uniflora]|uniref:Epoxide hydrolase n=1 Tax=Kingdonia uniflora TaxID=39325 RepID=A0A7J7MS79_9MAGN|nr:hypothetical protein GIB67_004486 [Kingdonia uniflora]